MKDHEPRDAGDTGLRVSVYHGHLAGAPDLERSA
jgi:hypothetical protein